MLRIIVCMLCTDYTSRSERDLIATCDVLPHSLPGIPSMSIVGVGVIAACPPFGFHCGLSASLFSLQFHIMKRSRASTQGHTIPLHMLHPPFRLLPDIYSLATPSQFRPESAKHKPCSQSPSVVLRSIHPRNTHTSHYPHTTAFTPGFCLFDIKTTGLETPCRILLNCSPSLVAMSLSSSIISHHESLYG